MEERNYQCSAPFVGLYYHITGQMTPCGFINISDIQSIDDYKKSEVLKQLRNDILQNKRRDICECCHKLDDFNLGSPREHWMNNIGYSDPENTDIQYLELKFSNLCNSKCRICNPYSSSQIATEEIKYQSKTFNRDAYITPGDENFLLSQVKLIGKNLKSVTFSGGEPLLHWQHWDTLDYFIENNYKPNLIYYSNAGKLTFQNIHIFDKWKHFEKIEYRVSIDGVGEAAEYWRPGEPFSQVYQNLISISKNMPQVKLRFTISIAWPMVFRYIELLETLYTIQDDIDIGWNVLQGQSKFYDPKVLPIEYKDKFKVYITEYLTTKNNESLSYNVERLLSYMYGEDWSYLLKDSINEIIKLDKRRNQDFLSVFPEYKNLIETYGTK